jgi:hypothetical protein
MTALDSFRIPTNWFTEVFDAEKGQELRAQYAEEFAYFEWDTLSGFDSIDKADKSIIKTDVCVGLGISVPDECGNFASHHAAYRGICSRTVTASGTISRVPNHALRHWIIAFAGALARFSGHRERIYCSQGNRRADSELRETNSNPTTKRDSPQWADASHRAVLEAAPDVMVVNRTGEIVGVNGQAQRLYGYSREHLIGNVVESLICLRGYPTCRPKI